MKDILLKLKEAYLENVEVFKEENIYVINNYRCVGLCQASFWFLDLNECKLFQKYLDKFRKSQKIFYDCEGKEVSDKDQFLWNPKDVQVRLDWLNEQILINK